MRRLSPAATVSALLLLALACARVVAPKGGPADTKAPAVDTVMPPPGPGLAGLRSVVIEFDERVEPASVVPSLFPPLEHSVEAGGSRLKIELARPLDSGLVVVNLPRTLADRHGNEMAEITSLVFGAGDSIPSGALRAELSRQGGGRVSEAAIVDLTLEDGTLARRGTPDTSGVALLRWLEAGTYAVTAYEDDDLSRSWDSDREAGTDTTLALAAGDTLTVPLVLTVLDTLPPSLIEAEPRDRHHLFVLTSEEVGWGGFRDASVALVDSAGDSVRVWGMWPAGGRGSSGMMLVTGAMCDCEMTLRIADFADLMGNRRGLDSLRFWGTDSLPDDSLRVEGTLPYPGEQDVDPYGPYQIAFTSWVSLDSVAARLTLTHVSADTTAPVSLSRVNGRIINIEPLEPLLGQQQYRLDLDSGLVSVWGQAVDGYSWSFTPRWADLPGSISGRVTGYPGPVMLQVSGAGEGGEVSYHRVASGDYLIEGLEAGRYTVSAFADGDGDGRWGAGEAYGTYAGVVMVYPGTETDGIDIQILP